MAMRLVVLMLLAVSAGCIHQPCSLPKTPIRFRNCRITKHSDDGQAVACDCTKSTQEIDAKTGQIVLVCLE
jgi:hypothetical protein